jgi:hypothetical protein
MFQISTKKLSILLLLTTFFFWRKNETEFVDAEI